MQSTLEQTTLEAAGIALGDSLTDIEQLGQGQMAEAMDFRMTAATQTDEIRRRLIAVIPVEVMCVNRAHGITNRAMAHQSHDATHGSSSGMSR